MTSLVNSTEYLNDNQSLKLSQKKNRRIFSNLFYKANLTWTTKPDDDTKDNYKQTSLMYIKYENPQQHISQPSSTTY